MKKLIAVIGVLCSSMAFAGGESGFYIGAGAGSWDTNIDFVDITELPSITDDFDNDSEMYKVIFGYNLGIIPLIDLGIEASYNYFDGMGDNLNANDVDIDADAFILQAIAGLSFGPIGLYAKAGVADWEIEIDTNSVDPTEDGSDPVYGLGVRFQIASLTVRAEYEYYDLEDYIDFETYNVSLLYHF